jgi:hypothetical protein
VFKVLRDQQDLKVSREHKVFKVLQGPQDLRVFKVLPEELEEQDLKVPKVP